jgi:hypothetical protein
MADIRPTAAELTSFRKLLQRVEKECEERLSREMTLVYALNEPRTLVLAAHYLSKGEAAEMTKVPGVFLLDLDHVYGGVLVRNDCVFVSEQMLAEGLRKYQPAALGRGALPL